MNHAFKFCAIVFCAALAMGDRALAQCFVCGDVSGNTAVGENALVNVSTGIYNNASGYRALFANNVGSNNNAQGSFALTANISGYGNTAMGANSLLSLTTGFRNVGVGNNTGTELVTGSYNVDIGWGVSGSGDETGVVRIGNPNYVQQAYIAGINNTVVTGAAVYISANGELGVLASSERYKNDINSLSANADKLQRLRPVSFHLKTEPAGALQYGLIAEEVDKVYPELVIRDKDGKIQGVRYDELAPILLSQLQKQQKQIAEISQLKRQIKQQEVKLLQEQWRLDNFEQLRQQVVELKHVNQTMQATLATLLARDTRVVMR